MANTPYYVFDANSFIDNFNSLDREFKTIYPNYQIAYSFKTNYTPAVCKIILELGGYAEVVSDMEFELARKIGFPIEHIIYNGPGKEKCYKDCVYNGGLLNIDNFHEVYSLCELSHPSEIKVGLRVNFDVGNGLHSRFGIDAYNGDLEKAIYILKDNGIRVNGLHFHISRARNLDAWKKRIDTLLEIADTVEGLLNCELDYLDLGSGMFGDLVDKLKIQFPDVPSYHDYAEVVAGTMATHFFSRDKKPMLLTEPGTTLVSRYFSLFATVLDIKKIRDKNFALLDCSFHNAGEICGLKSVPMEIVEKTGKEQFYDSIDLVGYTCLEQDIIYHNYSGELGVGSTVKFENVGGYSIVDKPPFIHPDIPIFMDKDSNRTCIKRAQTLDDIFAPYYF